MRALPLLFALAAVCGLPACKEAYQFTNLYGFTSLEPPSNLYQAGAVVVVQWVDKGGVPTVGGLKVVCGPRASLGPGWQPVESETLASEQTRNMKSVFNLDGEVLDRIRSKQSFEDVQDVSITLENARIVEVVDADIVANLANRSDSCREAIIARINGGFDITMVSSNIVADVTYAVRWKQTTSVSKEVRVEQMNQLAANFGGGHTYVDDRRIHAKNLAIGIKTDTYLLSLSLPPRCGEMIDANHRGLDVQAAMADADPDAPVVKSNVHEVQRIRGRADR